MFAETACTRKREFALTCEKRGRGARATQATRHQQLSIPANPNFELRARRLLFFSFHVAQACGFASQTPQVVELGTANFG